VPSRLRIVVTGLIAQHPGLGGVAWDYLQYPLGLARLGHDVYYLEDSGEWPYLTEGGDDRESWIAHDPTPNVEHLARTMARFGLADRWMYRFPIKPRWYGLSHARRREVLATADLLLNVSGTLRRPSDYRAIPRLAYIDSDPVFTQVKLAMPRGQTKFQRRVAAHDVHFSFGERLETRAPSGPYRWLPTRQPVVLDEWRYEGTPTRGFTTVMSWTSYPPLRFRGRSYGQKDAEFAAYTGLARAVPGAALEVALGPTRHDGWEVSGSTGDPRALLGDAGWKVVDAGRVCGTLDAYRSFIRSSRAEWSVAKNGYVVGQPGWFSCRSACYLAAGRPVVVQDTGFRNVLPTGEGILVFSSPDEAAAAIEEVRGHYGRHARAAGELSAAYFDSDRVLARLVDDAMAARPAVSGAAA
jgi:hypothetical protein